MASATRVAPAELLGPDRKAMMIGGKKDSIKEYIPTQNASRLKDRKAMVTARTPQTMIRTRLSKSARASVDPMTVSPLAGTL